MEFSNDFGAAFSLAEELDFPGVVDPTFHHQRSPPVQSPATRKLLDSPNEINLLQSILCETPKDQTPFPGLDSGFSEVSGDRHFNFSSSNSPLADLASEKTEPTLRPRASTIGVDPLFPDTSDTHLSSNLSLPEVPLVGLQPSSQKRPSSGLKKRKVKENVYEVSTEIQRARRIKTGVQKIFKSPIPSKFCHICGRKPNEKRRNIICSRNQTGACRKITCEACLGKLEKSTSIAELELSGQWTCSHCRGACPPSAQCTYYSRTNDRRVRKVATQGDALLFEGSPVSSKI